MSAQPSQFIFLEDNMDENYEPTSQEIAEYAEMLGFNLSEDKDLLWIARDGLKAPLPENWRAVGTSEGDVYYYNTVTEETSWDHPMDEFYKQKYEQEKRKKMAAKLGGSLLAASVPAKTKRPSSAGNDPATFNTPGFSNNSSTEDVFNFKKNATGSFDSNTTILEGQPQLSQLAPSKAKDGPATSLKGGTAESSISGAQTNASVIKMTTSNVTGKTTDGNSSLHATDLDIPAVDLTVSRTPTVSQTDLQTSLSLTASKNAPTEREKQSLRESLSDSLARINSISLDPNKPARSVLPDKQASFSAVSNVPRAQAPDLSERPIHESGKDSSEPPQAPSTVSVLPGLDHMVHSNATELLKLAQSHSDEMRKMTALHNEEIRTINLEHGRIISDIATKHNEELRQIRAQHEDETRTLKKQLWDDLSSVKQQIHKTNEQDIAQLRQRYEEEKKRIQAQLTNEMNYYMSAGKKQPDDGAFESERLLEIRSLDAEIDERKRTLQNLQENIASLHKTLTDETARRQTAQQYMPFNCDTNYSQGMNQNVTSYEYANAQNQAINSPTNVSFAPQNPNDAADGISNPEQRLSSIIDIDVFSSFGNIVLHCLPDPIRFILLRESYKVIVLTDWLRSEKNKLDLSIKALEAKRNAFLAENKVHYESGDRKARQSHLYTERKLLDAESARTNSLVKQYKTANTWVKNIRQLINLVVNFLVRYFGRGAEILEYLTTEYALNDELFDYGSPIDSACFYKRLSDISESSSIGGNAFFLNMPPLASLDTPVVCKNSREKTLATRKQKEEHIRMTVQAMFSLEDISLQRHISESLFCRNLSDDNSADTSNLTTSMALNQVYSAMAMEFGSPILYDKIQDSYYYEHRERIPSLVAKFYRMNGAEIGQSLALSGSGDSSDASPPSRRHPVPPRYNSARESKKQQDAAPKDVPKATDDRRVSSTRGHHKNENKYVSDHRIALSPGKRSVVYVVDPTMHISDQNAVMRHNFAEDIVRNHSKWLEDFKNNL